MSRMVIDDEMWSPVKKVLPKPKGRHGDDDRLFMKAICWMLRTGAAWRDLPPAYGNWKSVYNRYNNWSKKGYITAILAELKKRWRARCLSVDFSISLSPTLSREGHYHTTQIPSAGEGADPGQTHEWAKNKQWRVLKFHQTTLSTSCGLSAGSSNFATSLDPAHNARDVGIWVEL